jgi:F0F1-type ATP synthase assembly protein I
MVERRGAGGSGSDAGGANGSRSAGRSTAPRVTPKALSGLEFAGIGIEFAAILIVLSLGGAWLDRRLGSSPMLLILGTVLGAAGGIFSMYRRLTRRSGERSGTGQRGAE